MGLGWANLPFDPGTDGEATECVAKHSRYEMCASLAHACVGSDLEI
jgi:hypothetical protein